MEQTNLFVAKYVFEKAFTELINKSGLPLYVLEPLLRDAYKDIKTALDKETQVQIKAYNASVETGRANEVSK